MVGFNSLAAVFVIYFSLIHIFLCGNIEKGLESNEAFMKRKTCTIAVMNMNYSFWKHGMTCLNPSASE